MDERGDIIIGIDLGTTNSLVGYADEAGPHLIPGPGGDDDVILPSVIGLNTESNELTVGREAREHAVERPTTTVHSIKRLMGKGLGDLAEDIGRLPYRIERRATDENDDRDVVSIHLGDTAYTAPELSALILAELKRRAERHLGCAVGRAVVTVPAQFDDAQRQATRDAGRLAGLDVVRIVNEPTAAALAYGLDRAERATIAVYDLGGGTFDISILRIEPGLFEVLATNGDTHLGGDDFDQILIDLFTREIREQFGIDIDAPAIRQRLRTLAEQTKIRLSRLEQAGIEIAIGEQHTYKRTISRGEFEAMIEPLIDRTVVACARAMTAAKVTGRQIDQVVMVGGSTRVPRVRRRIAELFGRRPYTAINPEHVVAMGAAVQASILGGTARDLLLLDVTPLSLGIETLGGAMGKLILANTRIPCQASETFTTFKDGQTKVRINVLQGERELARDCRTLGVFELCDIPPMPAGIPKIDVSFLIDQNGILNVSALEQRSGQTASVQIVPSHGLTRDEVSRMEKAALKHAQEDMTAHHLIDVRATLSFDLNKAGQMIEKFGHLLEADECAQLADSLAELRRFAEKCDDPVELNQRREAFNHRTLRLAELAITQSLSA